MKSVFISSRMNELAMERRIAFRTCNYFDLRPLMFETEPIKNVRDSINDMIDAAEIFIGIYYKTIGVRNYNLCNLTPIEYEISYFICNQCSSKNNDNICNCIRNIRDILTSHIELFDNNFHVTNNGSVDNPADIYYQCTEAIEKARERIYIFWKLFNDEHAMSTQLYAFLDGITKQKITHVNFEDEWQLARKLVKSLPKSEKQDVENNNNKKTSNLIFRYDGIDQRGQIKYLSKLAFENHLNIEYLQVKTYSENSEKKSRIIAILKNYSLENENENLTENLTKKIKELRMPTEMNSHNRGYLFPDTKNSPISIKIEKSLKDEAKFKRKIEGFEKDFGVDDSLLEIDNYNKQIHKKNNMKNNVEYGGIIIRIYHLNVPGIIYNITKILSGDERFEVQYNFNIERMLVKKRHSGYYFNYKRRKRNFKNTKILPVKYKYWMAEKHQITELFLSFKKNKFSKDSAEIIVLENILNSIIGVIRVLISQEETIRGNENSGQSIIAK